ncbi:MAG: CAP domain-containing protein [Firmicutes bacterium]|nr:CAP domain-containing protein [Bacillota bacterium]
MKRWIIPLLALVLALSLAACAASGGEMLAASSTESGAGETEEAGETSAAPATEASAPTEEPESQPGETGAAEPTEATEETAAVTEAATEATTATTQVTTPAATESTTATEPQETTSSNQGSSNQSTTPTTSNQGSTGETEGDNGYYSSDPQIPEDTDEDICTEHDMVLANREIQTEFQLYDYAIDEYKCSTCGYREYLAHVVAKENLTNAEIQAAEAELVAYVNQLRAENGLSQLWTSSEWDAWADIRSQELSVVFGHRRPDGSTCGHTINGDYTHAENVSCGAASADDFFNAFYSSASHRSSMLLEDVYGIAVSIYVTDDGTTYCAMVLIGD